MSIANLTLSLRLEEVGGTLNTFLNVVRRLSATYFTESPLFLDVTSLFRLNLVFCYWSFSTIPYAALHQI